MTEASIKTRKPPRIAREPASSASTTIALEQPADLQQAPSEDAQSMGATKSTILLELLGREKGATLDQMVEALGWQPHTTRAALTGLKKRGHVISSEKSDSVRTYRLTKAGE